MPVKSDKFSRFWHELKRRKVFRVIIVYAAAGFAIIEFVDIVTEPLNLPEWALTLVIVLVAVGFPLAVILAWAYDITPSGIEKTLPVDTLKKLRNDKSSDYKAPLQEKSIIVLPLEDISPEKDNEYFADGLTEEITADLSQINDLLVISRSSAMTFKGTKKKLIEIANEVNVRYVLEGSVRKAANKLRITAQLIDATSDTHLWAGKYDGILNDVFDIQEKVSHDIVTAMKLKLTTDEKNRIALRPIDNFEAYDFYLRANQELWQFTADALDRGLKYLQHAADIIGDNDLLYSAMALIYFQYVNMGFKQEDYVIKAEKFARKALSINPDSSAAHHVMGITALVFHGNPREAVHYLKHALTIEPSLLPALYSLIGVYCYCGKISAAIPLVERLKSVNPLSFQRYIFEGFLRFFDGKYDAALDSFRHSYEIDPGNSVNWWYAWALANCNKYDEAVSVIEKVANKNFKDGQIEITQIVKLALLKDKEKILKIIATDFQKTGKRHGTYSYIISSILASLGEKEKALDWLENAVDRGLLNYPLLAEKDPFFENIRGEERFKKLMKIVKYKWENFEV